MKVKDLFPTKHFYGLWVKGSVALFFLILVFVSNPFAAEEIQKAASLEEFTAHLDARVPALMEEYAVPGVNMALIQKGRTVWSKAYGYADLANERRMTTDTYCRVESVSKSVTAWGVMKLVEQGKIELDEPVDRYLKNWKFPESAFSGEGITVRQLLTHTAGMPLGDFLDRYPPKAEMPSLEESLTQKAVPFQKPGVSFSYSNTGYNLLELLIEEVTGLDFAAYMEKEILIPLGMFRSGFEWSEGFDPAVPVGYGLKGNPIPVYVYPEKASGGLFACVEDIAAFVAAGMGSSYTKQQVLSSRHIRELYRPTVEKIGVYGLVFDAYGMGYYIEPLSDGRQSVANGGQGGGVMTYFQAVPKTGDGIVILTNSQRSWPFFGYILRDWSDWNRVDAVGFGKIILAQKVLWAFIGLILFFAFRQVLGLGYGLVSGRRRFTPLSGGPRLLRFTQAGLSVILLSGLFWCSRQEYLFISSVFPIASGWLGFSALAAAGALLLSSLFPRETANQIKTGS